MKTASVTKAPEIMASKSCPEPVEAASPPEREPVSLEAFGQDILRRRAAAGDPPVPRNAGNNRTASKRALLKAIEEAGGKW